MTNVFVDGAWSDVYSRVRKGVDDTFSIHNDSSDNAYSWSISVAVIYKKQ